MSRLAEDALARRQGTQAGGVDLRLAEVLRVGPFPPSRLAARVTGFEVAADAAEAMRGSTVLVLDDVFTSGARALSAAAALGRAGADVAAVVPIGRLVRPGHNAATAAFYGHWSRSAWQPGTCAASRPAGVTLARLTGPTGVVSQIAA